MANIAPLRQRITDHGVKLARRASELAALQTRNAAPRLTGALVEGIEATEPTLSGTTVNTSIVGRAPHTRYVDEGTGIYGPRGARIFPRRPGGLLVFYWPVAGGIVAFRSVAGQPGQKFFHEPMPQRWHDALVAKTGLGNAL